jgi:ABC-type amino acid transport substrate-binding protein
MRGLAKCIAAGSHWLLIAMFLCTSVAPSYGQVDGGSGLPRAKIVVGTMRVPPFVLRSDDGQWSGLSIDLWKQIADDLKLPFVFREFDYDLPGLLDAVEHRQIDAVVAAIPITLPYFAAGLGIAVRGEPQGGLFGALNGVFTYKFAAAVAALGGLLFFVGTSIWLLERRRQNHFDSNPSRGIADGVWWAAVTMTSTGYGDKVPITLGGRIVAIIWMFASIFLVALFSATLASTFVVGRLRSAVNGPADLARVGVATVSGTMGEQWLSAQGLNARSYPFAIQAVKALQRGDVQALVYEKAMIGYMAKQYGWNDLQVLPHTLAVREYAIVLPIDSAIKRPINRALLKVVHGAGWKDIVQHYLGGAGQIVSAD